MINGTYPVANKLTTEAANTAGRANCSPARNARINVVATTNTNENKDESVSKE